MDTATTHGLHARDGRWRVTLTEGQEEILFLLTQYEQNLATHDLFHTDQFNSADLHTLETLGLIAIEHCGCAEAKSVFIIASQVDPRAG